MKTINAILICSAAALLLCACQSEWDQTGGNRLFFRASLTKGSAITTATLNAEGQKFVVNGYLEEDGRLEASRFINNVDFSYNNTLHKWEAPNCYWRNEVTTDFWCYAPKTFAHGSRILILPSTIITDADIKKMDLTYTMPSAPSDSTGAEILDDMIFAYARKKFTTSSGNVVNLTFQHPLSAIRFKTGTIASGFDIEGITIRGFHTQGNCHLAGVDSTPENSADSISFTWSGLTGASSNTGYCQKITLAQLSNGDMQTGNKVFMVIPQTLTDDVTVSVDFVKNADHSKVTKTASLGGSAVTWTAGKYYTYKLSFNGATDFTVTLQDFNGESWNTHGTDGTDTGEFTGENW